MLRRLLQETLHYFGETIPSAQIALSDTCSVNSIAMSYIIRHFIQLFIYSLKEYWSYPPSTRRPRRLLQDM